MSQLIDNLTAAVAAEVANSTALKSKLDAAVSANADLTAQLQASQANAITDAERQQIQDAIQKLSDSTAVNNPAN